MEQAEAERRGFQVLSGDKPEMRMTAEHTASPTSEPFEPTAQSLRGLLDAIDPLRGRVRDLERLDDPHAPPDSPSKVFALDGRRRAVAVVILSPPTAPEVVAQRTEAGEQCRALLGPELGRVVIEPLDHGRIDGRSYAVLPWQRPLTTSKGMVALQRRWLRGHVFRWLREAAAAAKAEHRRRGTPADFHAPLRQVCDSPGLDSPIVDAAGHALERLDSGRWEPTHLFDHNDFWAGNILLATRHSRVRSGYPFFVIDWGGANVAGFGVFDLVRLMMSFGIGPRRRRLEIERYAQALGIDPADVTGHLLAALGHLGLNRGQFAQDKYIDLLRQCWRTIASTA